MTERGGSTSHTAILARALGLPAVAAGAEGVGLFRTEFGFLDHADAPSVDEQEAAYRRVFSAFGGRRVVVRTLDAGADKPLPFLAAELWTIRKHWHRWTSPATRRQWRSAGSARRTCMDLLRGEDFNQLFRDFRRSAFHLEMQDEYHVTEEIEPFRKWLNNEPDDYEWVREWHELIKDATAAGKSVQRARVVTEPVTDYVRFEHAMARFNAAAGEQLYWVPRQLTTGIAFPEHDFWLVDEEVVAFHIFTEDGRSFSAKLVTDRAAVEQCMRVRDHLLVIGIPHERYLLR